MMKNNIANIIKKYLSTRFPTKTEEKVQRWLIKDENTEEKESASLDYWDSLEVAPNSKTDSALERVNQRIGHSQKQTIKVPLYKRLSRVAAILIPLFMAIGGYLYYESTQNNMVEVYVAYGEEKHLFLPDSSEIWVNAGSTIRYPKEFKGDKRTVQLDGEAYLSVQKDESKPFVVETNNLSVKVLGTKFNVKAYSNDNRTITTLTSGRIEVNTETKKSRILEPNQQLSYDNKTSAIDIVAVLADETLGWVNGQLIFTDAPLDEILQTLERRFNISIESSKYQSKELYTIKFLKNDSLDDVLNILQDVVGFSFEKQGDKIIVK